jgi:multisubunit Na+/H+ antiporter MnhB subunit
VFWGLFVHIAIFFMLFGMKKDPRREDRIFGYWLGVVGSVVAAIALGLSFAAASAHPAIKFSLTTYWLLLFLGLAVLVTACLALWTPLPPLPPSGERRDASGAEPKE